MSASPASGTMAARKRTLQREDMPLNALHKIKRERTSGNVLDASIDALDWAAAIRQLDAWAQRRESRCAYLCNVHSVVTARRDTAFGRVLKDADIALPDGAPIAWALRRLGFHGQPRLSGPDLMWHLLEQCETAGHVVSFFGSTPEVQDKLRGVLSTAFPRLRIGAMISPPFHSRRVEDDAHFVEQINDAGTQVLFVGLGCPKQEHWMHAHRGRVQAVMLGVGAAFSFHAGLQKRAPHWMQRHGLEWLHRLAHEPRRLAWRYISTNSIFVIGMARQAVSSRLRRR